MKKKVFIVLGFVLVLGFGVLLGTSFSKSDVYEEEDYVPKVSHKNMLSMMLETDSGSGEYTLETRSSWPTKEDGYVFNSTLSKCEKGSKLSWDDENNAVIMEASMSDKCYIYFDKLPTLSEWVIAQYTGTQGENNLYYHNGTILGEDGTILDAGDNSYRYAGASDTTNNFVCFGNEETTCPDDNLYRIIGVFGDQVKLIKWDYATGTLLGTDGDYGGTLPYYTSYYQGDSSNLTNIAKYYWNKTNYDASYTATGYYNDWSYSELNKTNLNKNFLNNIGSIWASMIDTTEWIVGGFGNKRLIPSLTYAREVINPSNDEVIGTYKSQIGLMYVSDYGFAANPSAWTTTLWNYNSNDSDGNKITEENWMYMGLDEWTITRITAGGSISYKANYIDHIGFGGYDDTYEFIEICANAVRPVFYLNSDVTYVSGSGTKSDPIRIN